MAGAGVGQVPEKVAVLAGRRNLGALIAVRKGRSPVRQIALAVGVFVLASIIALALGGLGVHGSGKFRLAVLAALIGAPLYVLYVLATGSRSFYLFNGGIVYVKNWRILDVAWPQVREMVVRQSENVYSGDGSKPMRRFVLHRNDSRKVSIDVGADADGFGDRLVAQARRVNLPTKGI